MWELPENVLEIISGPSGKKLEFNARSSRKKLVDNDEMYTRI